ncbi:MAG: GspE/PulE family protein [Opitutaceae bacterium]|nr:GspE/PulE family protein [Opitutaceae bacterium]
MVSHSATAPVTRQLPLYLPRREQPRPSARAWISAWSQKFSLASPFNHGQPWLPLTAIEGLLVLGHKDPDAPHGDIPDELTVRVLLRPRDYDLIRDRCLEALAAFQGDAPVLTRAWSDFRTGLNGSPAFQAPLQFLLHYGLAPRATKATNAAQYLAEHKDAEWVFRGVARHLPILPVEDIHPNHIPIGKLPDTLVNKFKAVCYELDGDDLYILLPYGSNAGSFRTELASRTEGTLRAHLAYGDPEALTKFVESTSVTGLADRSVAEGPEPFDDDGILACDPQLLAQGVASLREARDVLAWALGHAIKVNATDVHFDPQDLATAVIRLRLNGTLKTFGRIPTAMLQRVISVAKIRAGMNSTDVRLPQDGKFRVKFEERECDIRLSTIPEYKTEAIEGAAMRVLGRVRIPTIKDLGISPSQMSQIDWVLKRDHGIFLVTGPTGSGKTTSLNCFLRAVAGEHINCMSVEDPVEIPLPWVKQVQVNPAIEFGFDTALRSFLRQDPDVIMVGEVRDAETAQISQRAAQTGHLVFATLHTNNALLSFARLEELGIPRSVIASSLIGVQAQRLVRCVCPQCHEQIPLPDDQRGYVSRYLKRLEKNLVPEPAEAEARELIVQLQAWLEAGLTYRAAGCASCNQTGFHRRTAVMEIYLVGNDPAVLDLLLENRPIREIQRYYDGQGHLDLASHMIQLYARHETTFAEIEAHLPML